MLFRLSFSLPPQIVRLGLGLQAPTVFKTVKQTQFKKQALESNLRHIGLYFSFIVITHKAVVRQWQRIIYMESALGLAYIFHFSQTLRNSINLKFSTVINNYSYNYRYYHSILSLCAYRPYSVGLWGSYLQDDRITILGMAFSLNKNHSRISVEYVRHTLIFRLAVVLIGQLLITQQAYIPTFNQGW